MTALGARDSFGAKPALPLSEFPQSIQLIDADELHSRAARTIGDALRAVPSAGPGSPRGVPFQNLAITIRGFAVDQMRNGVRQRNYEAVDPGSLINIERIEVLKGPSGVLFGQSAVGGIVSIITKQPEESWAATVQASLGSFDQALVGADVTGPLLADGRLGFRLTGEIERSQTFADFVPLNRENVGLSLSSMPAPGIAGHFVFEWAARRTVGNSGQPPVGTVLSNGIAPIPQSRFLSEPGFASLHIEAPLVQAWVDVALGRGWTLTPRVSWNGFSQSVVRTGLRNLQPDLRTLNRFAFAGTSKGDFLVTQAELAGRARTGPIGHELLFGFEWADEDSSVTQDRPGVVPPIDVLEPVYGRLAGPPWPAAARSSSHLRSFAFYAQDLIEMNEALQVVLGLRYASFATRVEVNDIPDQASFDNVVWQASANWQLGSGFSLFGGANTGFNVDPIVGGRSETGAPFAPERSRQVEIGVRQQGPSLQASVSLFRLTRDNVLTADPDQPFFDIQTGRQRTQGLEMEATWLPGHGWTIMGGYAFIPSRILLSNNGDMGDRIADVPLNRATLFVEWTPDPVPALSLRAGGYYVGKRQLSNARVRLAPGLLASDVTLPAYATAQFGIAWRFDRFELDASLTNAFNARYYVYGGEAYIVYPGEPRFFSFCVTSFF